LNRLENEWINDESEKLFARFITLLGDFTYAGFNELKLPMRPETIIDIPNFIMPQPKKTGRKIFSSLSNSFFEFNQVLLFVIFLHLQFFNQFSNKFVKLSFLFSYRIYFPSPHIHFLSI
jgi:hypothetical protein